MEINKCRVCNSSNLETVIDLGPQALSGKFQEDGLSVKKENISLYMCSSCGLTQTKEIYDLDDLYNSGYGYESSLNQTMIDHLKNKAEYFKKFLNILRISTMMHMN